MKKDVKDIRDKKFIIYMVVMFITCFVLSPVVMLAGDSPTSRKSLEGIKAISVLMEKLPPDLIKTGLNMDIIRLEVELRLRLAGLTVGASTEVPFLYVNINGFKQSEHPLYVVNVAVELCQDVYLARSPETWITGVTTWSIEDVAIMGEKTLYEEVRRKTNDLVDRFINAYLSVNPKGEK